MTKAKTRKWTVIERLLDEVWHEPDLARKKEWRDRVFHALPGCPANEPSGVLLTEEVAND